MNVGSSSSSSIPSSLRLGLMLIIVLMVVSSPILIFIDPVLVSAKSSNNIDTSNHHSDPQATQQTSSSVPSTSSTPPTTTTTTTTTTTPQVSNQDNDFTSQAPLQIPRSFQSTDIVSSTGIYEITFITSTTGPIDKIRMDFPTDTNIGPAGVIEKVGIGSGTLTKVGNLLIYDIQTPVEVPSGTFIRLEISGIKNPTIPSNSLTVSIITTDIGNVAIDGPTQTNAYKMKRIGANDLGVNAVTSQKIADGAITFGKANENFMKKVMVEDDSAGHAIGWNPDAATTQFTISDSAIGFPLNTFVSIHIADISFVTTYNCQVYDTSFGQFIILCEISPPEGTKLQYIVTNLPGICVGQTSFCT